MATLSQLSIKRGYKTIDKPLEGITKDDFASCTNGEYVLSMTAPHGAECVFHLHIRKSSKGIHEACFDLYPGNLNYTIRRSSRLNARFLVNKTVGMSSFGPNQITFCFPAGEQGEKLFEAAQFICDPTNLEPITIESIWAIGRH